jgi:hypothetical protein
MMIFLGWFEKRNDPDLVNATFDGARISSVVHRPSDELSFPERDDIPSRIDALFSSAEPSAEEKKARREKLSSMVAQMILSSTELSVKLEKAVKLSEDLCRQFETGLPDSGKVGYILGKLSDVDRSLESLGEAKDMIGLTVQRVIHTITEGYNIDEGTAVSKEHAVALKSLYLYKGLSEGTSFALKSLDRIQKIL